MIRENESNYENIELIIPKEVQALMEERLILAADIQKVISFAESAGYKVWMPKTNRYTAYYKPGRITYWVEYGKEDEKYHVYNAYSHRVEINEDVKIDES